MISGLVCNFGSRSNGSNQFFCELPLQQAEGLFNLFSPSNWCSSWNLLLFERPISIAKRVKIEELAATASKIGDEGSFLRTIPQLAPSRKVWTKRCVCCFFFSVWEFLGVKFMLVEDSFQGGTPGHAGAGLGSWDWNADLCRSGSGAGSKNHGSTFSTRKMPFSFISWFHVPFARWVYGILMQDLMGLLNFFFHVIYVNGDAKMLVFLNLNILTWSRCLVLKV